MNTSTAARALDAATRLWFAVAIGGQLLFAFTIASVYGRAAAQGQWRAWNKSMSHGYVPGDTAGNAAVAIHLLSAALILIAGTIQVVPNFRERAPALHRWNGRLYFVTAFTVSLAGLHMMWVRGIGGDLPQHLGTSLMAVLIMLFAVMALRSARARDFRVHRRWALRLYLAVSASLFIRAALFLAVTLNRGPFGFDPSTLTGPYLTFISFAQYLVPLAVLELYFRVQERPHPPRQLALASGLFVLAIALALGVVATTMAVWLPKLKRAYDPRISIADTLAATIDTSGVEAAAERYHELKASAPATYNFDDRELNALGYELVHARRYKEAIRVFQLNVETYPRSSNAYDSLGEGYLEGGDRPRAIASYRRALDLDPRSTSAARALDSLGAR